MASSKIASRYAYLDFNSPLSDARVETIIRSLQPLANARVVDIGCGWAELLLRVAAAEPTVRAVGIDSDDEAIARGRANAAARGLADRVELRVVDAAEPASPVTGFDVAICVGSSHALGGTAPGLAALARMVRPGGRVVLGDGFWLRPPTEAATAALGGDPDEFGTLADLVDLAVARGLRPLAISEASTDEWDAFESNYALAWERWLLDNPDDPQAAEIRARADQHREGWLRGYRGVLGFAYLTLASHPPLS